MATPGEKASDVRRDEWLTARPRQGCSVSNMLGTRSTPKGPLSVSPIGTEQAHGFESLSVSSPVSCEAQRSLGLGQGLSRREQAACQAARGHPGAGLSHVLGCGFSEASPASTWT